MPAKHLSALRLVALASLGLGLLCSRLGAAEITAMQDEQILRDNVEKLYGPFLGLFRLPPEKLAQVKRLLFQRELAGYRARVAFDAQKNAASLEAVRAGSSSPLTLEESTAQGRAWREESIKVARDAEATVDAEIQASVDPTTYARIELLLAAGSGLLWVQHGAAHACFEAGCPLSIDQMLHLAVSGRTVWDNRPPPKHAMELLPIDEEGLTPTDKEVLAQVRPWLSEPQVAAVKVAMADTNAERDASMSTVPVNAYRPSR